MREDLLKILSNSNKDIDNQKLMDYISGRLSAEEKHEVEKWMIDNPFFNEAVEGLQNVKGTENVSATVEQLNKQLRKYLKQKKIKRQKNILPLNVWTYIAVIFIIVLAVIVYMVLTKI
jgi:anti-sigma factor RsiW